MLREQQQVRITRDFPIGEEHYLAVRDKIGTVVQAKPVILVLVDGIGTLTLKPGDFTVEDKCRCCGQNLER